MLVDDNMHNLTTGKEMLTEFYEVFALPSAEKMFQFLGKVSPDLILLDIEMPVMNGYEALKKLKAEPKWADIPVIFLTARSDASSEIEGLSLGAIDYVFKPFSAPLLSRRIENHILIMEQRNELLKRRDILAAQKEELNYFNNHLKEMVQAKTAEVVELRNAILSSVAEMVEFRDELTGGHIEHTQAYLKVLVEALLEANLYHNEVTAWDMDILLPSAQLHDVGKIAISDAILRKPGKLTPAEYEEMKKHVAIGVTAIERIERNTRKNDFLRYAKIFAGTHHEKWDGTGYPKGLKGLEIPLQGRLMAIVDVYDALISVRAYKKALPPEEVERIIGEQSGTFFEPDLVDIFRRVAGQFALTAR
jgi:putative two-component system response regulator